MDNPITRKEMYLAAAAGERLNLPEPFTRVEYYLKRIAERYGGGTGTGGNAEDGFSPIAKVEQTATGAVISITDKDGTTEATITNGKDGADGQPGKDGKDGADGAPGATGPKGDKGDKGDTGAAGKDGANGKTPVRGTDYWTDADKTDMLNDVLAALPTWNGGSY